MYEPMPVAGNRGLLQPGGHDLPDGSPPFVRESRGLGAAADQPLQLGVKMVMSIIIAVFNLVADLSAGLGQASIDLPERSPRPTQNGLDRLLADAELGANRGHGQIVAVFPTQDLLPTVRQ